MAETNIFNLKLRSDVDKGEVSVDTDLRLRSYADRDISDPPSATIAQTTPAISQAFTTVADHRMTAPVIQITPAISQSLTATTITGTVVQALSTITQALDQPEAIYARISVHSLNAGFQTLEGISTHRFTQDPTSLPEDVVFYCPFNDDIGTSPASIKCYTSVAGETSVLTHTDFWLSYNSGAIIATPGTNPVGYSTCYNPGENSAGGGLSTDTTKGNGLFEDVCYGVDTNISIEVLYWLEADSNAATTYAYIFGWSQYGNDSGDDGDGFKTQFYSSHDHRIVHTNHWGSYPDRKSVTRYNGTGGLDKWYRVFMVWDLENSYTSIHVEHQGGSGGDTITSLPRRVAASVTNAAFEQHHDSADYADNLFMGAPDSPANRASGRYNGGMNELIVRINTPDMATITGSNPLVVSADPLL